MSWSVHWQVFINGANATIGMRPYLMSISVTDKAGATSDGCSLTFDDSYGQLRLPSNDEQVRVLLNGMQVFNGLISSVRSRGSKSGGRVLVVNAKGVDLRGKAKEPQKFHMDDAKLGDFLQTAAKKAGFSVKVHPSLAKIKRDYWSNDRQSFLHLGEKMARELGGTFKVRGTEAVLVPKGLDLGLPPILASFGSNLISWDIEPDSGRPKFASGAIDYLDRATGKIETLKSDYDKGATAAKAVEQARVLAADKSHAEQLMEGRKSSAKRKGGTGRVSIDIAPHAQAEAMCTVKGARSGVDGLYKVESVTHKASKSGGSSTDLTLEQPDGDAGKDGR